MPKDINLNIALSAIDVSSIVPQMYRAVRDSDQYILIIGCGKAGITAMSAIRKKAPKSYIICTDINEEQLKSAESLGYADKLISADATKPEEFLREIEKVTNNSLCDLVINVVNAPDTETSSILAAKPYHLNGRIYFYSMATNFDKAALGTDATGKDVHMIIGNGVCENQAEEMFNLLRTDKKLKEIYQEKYSNMD